MKNSCSQDNVNALDIYVFTLSRASESFEEYLLSFSVFVYLSVNLCLSVCLSLSFLFFLTKYLSSFPTREDDLTKFLYVFSGRHPSSNTFTCSGTVTMRNQCIYIIYICIIYIVHYLARFTFHFISEQRLH